MKANENYINWTQLNFIVAGAVSGLIFTAFATFATKESVANEFSLRTNARNSELTQLRSDISEIKSSQRETNTMLLQILRRR